MATPLRYETTSEAETRLHQSVFLHGNNPVLCEGIYLKGKDIRLKLTVLPRMYDMVDVSMDDPDLEFVRYHIGYLNLQEGASYMMRLPAKGRYKQGLCAENVMFTPFDKNGGCPNWSSVYKTAAFRDMLMMTYPSLDEAVTRLQTPNGPNSVAFDPHFALFNDKFRGDFLLHYRGHRIGYGSKEFQIPEEFSYLREIVLASGIKIR